jgi:AraC-like DNA-binding protein
MSGLFMTAIRSDGTAQRLEENGHVGGRSYNEGVASGAYKGSAAGWLPCPPAQLWAAGYREWLPPVPLRGSLTCLWVRVVAQAGGAQVSDVMPDGCSDLIWESGRGGYLAGPDTGPAPTELPAGTVVVGARFRPGAAGPALRLPLAELRDQRVDLSAVLPRLATQLAPDLPPDAALNLVTAWSARLVSDGPPDPVADQGARLLAGGRASVRDLPGMLAVSERQLLRRFDAAVGYGPKTLQRVLRFRTVLAQLSAAGHRMDLAALAVRAGYADQAHLTRETTRLAGRPPAALARYLAPGA